MKELVIRILIICIVVILVNCLIYAISPNFQENDIYEINGKCLDIYAEKEYAGKHRVIRMYLYMDNGEKYRITNTLIDYIGDDLNELKNKNISFYASDKSIFWYDDHQVVALGHIKDKTLKETNQENFIDRLILGVLSLIIGFLFLVPQILRVSAQCDAKKEAIVLQIEKKARRQRIVDKHLPSISAHKTKPQNISKKNGNKERKI